MQLDIAIDSSMLAAYAALLSTFVAVWNIFTYLRSGTRLKFYLLPEVSEDETPKRVITLYVMNVGNRLTTITGFWLFGYKNWLAYIRKKHTQAVRLNSVSPEDIGKLDVGETWHTGFYLKEFLRGLSTEKIRFKYLAFAIYDSTCGKPNLVRLDIEKFSKMPGYKEPGYED